MSKISEEQMIQFINENMSVLPATTKAGLEKYDVTTQYRKVRHYLNLHNKKNEPVQVTVSVVDQVMNIIKNGETTVEDLNSIIEQCADYAAEVKFKQITDIEEQIKTLQGQLKQLKK